MDPKVYQKAKANLAYAKAKLASANRSSINASAPTSPRNGSLKNVGRGGSAVYAKHLQKQDVLATIKTRQLQLVSGGRYRHFVFEKIVNFLKQEFLQEREKRLTLDQLLTEVKEPGVFGPVKEWLMEEALPGHPRVRIVELSQTVENRFAYEPPIKKLKFEAQLLKLLKSMHYNNEGGLLRTLVEDSMPLADSYIKNLQQRDKLIEITRIDRKHVLFYKPPTSDKLTVDDKFVELWRRVDVSNKEMHQIKLYLKNKKISVIDDEELDKEDREEIFGDSSAENTDLVSKRKRKKPSAIKPKPATKRRKCKIKDNVHVMEDLLDEDACDAEPVPSTSALTRLRLRRHR